MLWRWLEAAMGCRRGLQYDGKCSFYLNCYFFRTSPTNRDLREKAVYFPPRPFPNVRVPFFNVRVSFPNVREPFPNVRVPFPNVREPFYLGL